MLVKKKKGKLVEAYCLGEKNPVMDEFIRKGDVVEKGNGVYEIYSQEAVNGKGEVAYKGDYIKVDSSGKIYPNSKNFFEQNHKKIEENLYEQIPALLMAWTVEEERTEEIEYLIREEKLTINEQDEKKYFEAFLWGTLLAAPKDAVIVFYEIKRNEDKKIENVDFNFVQYKEFFKSALTES